MEMEMEGIEMDDALPQKRWKKELYTCTCTCTCQSCSLANQLNTNISCHHHYHPGCVNEVMIEFFSFAFVVGGYPCTYSRPDLFHLFIHHSPINGVPQLLNKYIRYKSTYRSMELLPTVPRYLTLSTYLTLPPTLIHTYVPHTTYLTDLGTGTGSFNSSSIKENPHDRQQSKHMIR